MSKDKENMYHSCRWCKHYDDGSCTRDNFQITDRDTWNDVTDEVKLLINEPESFYCKHWE